MPSPWITHVKQFQSHHPGMTYSEALKAASPSYSGGATSGGNIKTVFRKAKNTGKRVQKIARKTINTIDTVSPILEMAGVTVAPEIAVPYEAAKLVYKGSKLLNKGGSFKTQGGSFKTQGGSFKTQGGSFKTQGGSFKTQGGSFKVHGAGHAHTHGCSECGMKKPLCGSGFSKDFPKKPKTLYDEIHGY
jgi:hypothetical protein